MGRAVLVCLTCASSLTLIASCAMQESDAAGDERAIGSVGMNLEVADGVDLEQVSYTINTGAGAPITGTIAVTSSDAVQKVITGIPAGTADVTLRGTGRNGALCEGFGRTHVRGGRVSILAILLHCLLKGHRGNIDVTGRFNVCPEADLASCALTRATVGVPFQLTASGSDPDGDALAFHWTATAGSFSDATARSTMFTCDDAGAQTLEFSVDDGRGCSDTQEIPIFCDKGARPVCGNGQLETGEACDDGNRTAGDGCAPDCTEEPEPNGSVLCPTEGGGVLSRCTCENCSAEVEAVESGAGADLAIDLLECMETSGCRGQFCLCGAIGDVECFLTGTPQGPCVPEFLAAAQTTEEATAVSRMNNLAFPIGRAMAVDECSVDECGECL